MPYRSQKNAFSRTLMIASAALATLFLAGCAAPSKLMVAVPENEAISKPEAGKSMIVFLRPSGIGFALEAKVTDITSQEGMALVGIVGAKTKVAYQADPGERFFMVTGGENTSIMKALLEPDRTYYGLVSVHMGFLVGRFYLEPIRGADTGSEKFAGWLRGTTSMKNSEASYAWFNEKAGDLREKRDKLLSGWMEKDEEDRNKYTLFAQDGVP